jgi:hypothetical protein
MIPTVTVVGVFVRFRAPLQQRNPSFVIDCATVDDKVLDVAQFESTCDRIRSSEPVSGRL